MAIAADRLGKKAIRCAYPFEGAISETTGGFGFLGLASNPRPRVFLASWKPSARRFGAGQLHHFAQTQMGRRHLRQPAARSKAASRHLSPRPRDGYSARLASPFTAAEARPAGRRPAARRRGVVMARRASATAATRFLCSAANRCIRVSFPSASASLPTPIERKRSDRIWSYGFVAFRSGSSRTGGRDSRLERPWRRGHGCCGWPGMCGMRQATEAGIR